MLVSSHGPPLSAVQVPCGNAPFARINIRLRTASWMRSYAEDRQ